MAYSKEFVQDVLNYLDLGHSTREAEEHFNISHESAARWRRKRDGNLRINRPHPIKYPLETVRLALGLAYGKHGLTLDQTAVLVGVSAPTISNPKKRYVESGAMEIPEIDPDEIESMRTKDIEKMSKEELAQYIHELEVKSYVL